MSQVMSRPQEDRALAWSERNQRWLSQRIAFWSQRIARMPGQEPEELPPPAMPETPDDLEPAIVRVGSLFGLSAFERELLVLAAGVDIDTALRAAVGRAQGLAPGDPVRLNFSLALATLPHSHWDALSPLGGLRHWSLVDVDSSDGFTQARLRIDERILHYVTGVAAFDERLTGIAHLDYVTPDPAIDDLAIRIASAVSRLHQPALVLLADALADARRRRLARVLAGQAFAHLGLRMIWADVPPSGADARDLAEIARRLDREAALTTAGVALALDPDAAAAQASLRFLSALRSPVIALGSLGPLQLAALPGRQALRFTLPSASPRQSAGLPPALERAAGLALQQFHVDPALLEQALSSVDSLAGETTIETAVWGALRDAARGGLDALAQRIESRATFDDLVLPPFVAEQLRSISSQLRHRRQVYDEWGFADSHSRGLGVAALFAGESGTGKTLAAEAIANDARLDLYRIDLASVVSKYIGETEKNLSRLFDAAEASGAVLLFDEADALFGKRSEVKDSHDRYANIEVAYLLQRIETYRGLAILTTNQKSALDRAFLRRIRFVVSFPFPDEAAREEIWRRQFPGRAPLGQIDFKALARLQLAGGHIHSVALNAAFQAAGAGEAIGHAALVAAARMEFAKLERPMGDAQSRSAL